VLALLLGAVAQRPAQRDQALAVGVGNRDERAVGGEDARGARGCVLAGPAQSFERRADGRDAIA
jgi:hypothetical protein